MLLSEKLKKQAKHIKKLTGEKHMKILHQLALNNGFKSWAALLAKENGGD